MLISCDLLFELFVYFAHLFLLLAVSLQNGFDRLVLVVQILDIYLDLLDLFLLLEQSSFLLIVVDFKLIFELFHLLLKLLLNLLLLFQ